MAPPAVPVVLEIVLEVDAEVVAFDVTWFMVLLLLRVDMRTAMLILD